MKLDKKLEKKLIKLKEKALAHGYKWRGHTDIVAEHIDCMTEEELKGARSILDLLDGIEWETNVTFYILLPAKIAEYEAIRTAIR